LNVDENREQTRAIRDHDDDEPPAVACVSK